MQEKKLNLNIVRATSQSPYINIALENVMLNQLKGVTLFLWINDNTVVIGKNQNAYAEVDMNALKEFDTKLVRRLTGGGAVYQDKNNLNFTFIADKNTYDLERQLGIIIKAVKKFGINASFSGRNDIVVNEKKFSGNAFMHTKDMSLHHGTILIDTNPENLSRVLNVDKRKLKTYGVESVRSRVVNLKELSKDITVNELKKQIEEETIKEYGLKVNYFNADEFCHGEYESLFKEKYQLISDNNFIYGKNVKMENCVKAKFSWGMAEIFYTLVGDKITELEIFTDALDIHIKEVIQNALINQNINEMKNNLIVTQNQTYNSIIKDIVNII